MSKPIFEPGKEYRTRDGSTARIYAADGGYVIGRSDFYIFHGAVYDCTGGWAPECWRYDGRTHGGTDGNRDLMPPEPEKVRFLLWGSKAEGPDNGHILEVEIQPDGMLKAVR